MSIWGAYKSLFPLWNYFFANPEFGDMIRFDIHAIFYKYKIEKRRLDSFRFI